MPSVDGCNKTVFLYDDPDWVEYKRHQSKARQNSGFRKKMWFWAKSKEYLDAVHDYALFRGDVDTGRRRTMQGREAKTLNTEYERKFMDSKTARMYKWKWIKPADER
jgi:hypothetical protein